VHRFSRGAVENPGGINAKNAAEIDALSQAR